MPLILQRDDDDEEDVDNPDPQFVRAFDEFETFSEAASFIYDWIRV